MQGDAYSTYLKAKISPERCKELLVELVRVPSPQTDLLEAEPLVKDFIKTAVEPRLRAAGLSDIRYDSIGNLIAGYGEAMNGRSLMLIANAMNQPASTMPNPYSGDVVDGAQFGLPGECVMGKGASEQKANLAAMLHAIETVLASKRKIAGNLLFVCCTSGETGKHDAIRNVVEVENVRAAMAILGGNSLELSLGNRGRVDIRLIVKGSPSHSGKPWSGANAITGAVELIRRLQTQFDPGAPHPELGPRTLTVTHLRSFPDSTHTVQERCEMILDRRLLPGDDPQAAFSQIVEIAKTVESYEDPVSGKRFGLEAEMGAFMHPSLISESSPIAQAILEASRTMLGAPARTCFSPTAFDQGYLNHVGIPTANFGAGEQQYAHTDFDMASVDRTTDAARVYAYVAMRALAAVQEHEA